jgi:hypothetical protein
MLLPRFMSSIVIFTSFSFLPPAPGSLDPPAAAAAGGFLDWLNSPLSESWSIPASSLDAASRPSNTEQEGH